MRKNCDAIKMRKNHDNWAKLCQNMHVEPQREALSIGCCYAERAREQTNTNDKSIRIVLKKVQSARPVQNMHSEQQRSLGSIQEQKAGGIFR